MKFKLMLLAGMAAAAALAQAPKVALVNLEKALISTTDGQAAERRLDAQFGPRKAALDARQKELSALQDKIDKGGMSDEERQKLVIDLDEKSAEMDRDTTQADADLAVAQRRVLQELSPKLMAVVVRYAKSQGYDLIFDISSSDMPRLFAENATDITKEVIDEYERGTAQSAPKSSPPAKKK